MFRLEEIIKATAGKLVAGNLDKKISGVSIDSRIIKSSQAFLAIKGNRFNGYNFIQSVLKKGTPVVISSRFPRSKNGTAFIKVSDTRQAFFA